MPYVAKMDIKDMQLFALLDKIGMVYFHLNDINNNVSVSNYNFPYDVPGNGL